MSQTRASGEAPTALSEPESARAADPVSEVFVARQPILDRHQAVFAYELLYRSNRTNHCGVVSGVEATKDVVANALLHIGLERLVGPAVAFVNFDRELLLGDLSHLLLPGKIVIELLETISPDREVLARCRHLKAGGFSIALDDVTELDHLGDLVDIADFVKVDFRDTTPAQQERFARQLAKRGIRTLAEKVETVEEFEMALKFGYGLVQGYFFQRPQILTGSKIPSNKVAYLRLLREVAKPEPNLHKLEEALRCEPALVYKLLRYLNSAAFSWQRPIDSIGHALALLGTTQVRKWIGLLALAGLADGSRTALTPIAIIRARFCELIAGEAGRSDRSSELFLLGMLSILEAILRRPMEQVIQDVDLSEDIRRTLLGKAERGDAVAIIFSLALAYEGGKWDAVEDRAKTLGIPESTVARVYSESITWAEQMGIH